MAFESKRGGEEGQHGEVSKPGPRARGAVGIPAAQIGEDGAQEEDAGQDVPPLGDPRHGLDAERMDGEEEGGHRGRRARASSE